MKWRKIKKLWKKKHSIFIGCTIVLTDKNGNTVTTKIKDVKIHPGGGNKIKYTFSCEK